MAQQFNPLLLLAAPGALQSLQALFGGNNFGSQQFKKLNEMLAKFYGTGALGRETNQLYQTLQGSPMFGSMISNAGRIGSGIEGNINRSLGRSGFDSTALGGAARGIGRGIGALQVNQARGQLFGQALEATGQNFAQRATGSSYLGQSPLFTRGGVYPNEVSAGLLQALASIIESNPGILSGNQSRFDGGRQVGGGPRGVKYGNR